MVDWAELAATKYAILDREARAKEMQSEAQAEHLRTMSALAPQQTAAQIALDAAKTAAVKQEADLRPGESLAEQSYKRAQAGAAGSLGGYHEAMAAQAGVTTPAEFWGMLSERAGMPGAKTLSYEAFGGGPGGGDKGYRSLTGRPMGSYIREIAPPTTPSYSSPYPYTMGGEASEYERRTRGFARGTEMVDGDTTKVPGKGDGTVDKVPAKLAPGEAVLNKAAAELVGRDVIAALNQAGADIMGMDSHAVVPGGQKTPKVDPKAEEKGYACGTSKVRKYAQGTNEVQPVPLQPGSDGGYDQFAASLERQDPNRPMNVAMDMRRKMTGQPTGYAMGTEQVMPGGMPAMGEMEMADGGEEQTTGGMEMVSIPTSILDILIQALRDKGGDKAASKSKSKSEAKP